MSLTFPLAMAVTFAKTTPPASLSYQGMGQQMEAHSKKVKITLRHYHNSPPTVSVSLVIPDNSVSSTLMTADQIPVKTMPTALTVSLVSHAHVKLDSQAQHVEPISMTALLAYAKIMVLVRTSLMALHAAALQDTQEMRVGKTSTNVRLLR